LIVEEEKGWGGCRRVERGIRRERSGGVWASIVLQGGRDVSREGWLVVIVEGVKIFGKWI